MPSNADDSQYGQNEESRARLQALCVPLNADRLRINPIGTLASCIGGTVICYLMSSNKSLWRVDEVVVLVGQWAAYRACLPGVVGVHELGSPHRLIEHCRTSGQGNEVLLHGSISPRSFRRSRHRVCAARQMNVSIAKSGGSAAG